VPAEQGGEYAKSRSRVHSLSPEAESRASCVGIISERMAGVGREPAIDDGADQDPETGEAERDPHSRVLRCRHYRVGCRCPTQPSRTAFNYSSRYCTALHKACKVCCRAVKSGESRMPRASSPLLPTRLAVYHDLCALSPHAYAGVARLIAATLRAETLRQSRRSARRRASARLRSSTATAVDRASQSA
jgi:hypothetical protein